ncbi:MAG: RidA family protein [Betaproteobacteria bacterium]|nr:MAG: RidA family protein [Betaproteobacteria bacterium]
MPEDIARENIFPAGISKPNGHWTTVTTARPGKLVFVSGLTAKNERGELVGVGDIRAQTRQVCENLKLAMQAAGGTLADIVRVDVYIREMTGFKDIHEIRREYFGPNPPASTMVAVSAFTHPDMLIEINAIGVLP